MNTPIRHSNNISELVKSMGMGNPCGLTPTTLVGMGVGNVQANPPDTHTHMWVMYKPEPYSLFQQLGKQPYSFTLGNSNPELKSTNTITPLLVTIKQLHDILEVCHIM